MDEKQLFWIDKTLKSIALVVYSIVLLFFSELPIWAKIEMMIIVLSVLLLITLSGSKDNIKHNNIYQNRRNFVLFVVSYVVFAIIFIGGAYLQLSTVRYIGFLGFLVLFYKLTNKNFLAKPSKSTQKQ